MIKCRRCGRPVELVRGVFWEDTFGQMVCPAVWPATGPHEPGE